MFHDLVSESKVRHDINYKAMTCRLSFII